MNYGSDYGRSLDISPITVNGVQIHYTEPGNFSSPIKRGGFVFEYPNTVADAITQDPVNNLDYLSFGWAELIIEFLYVVPNTEEHFYGLGYAEFSRTAGGIIEGKFNNVVARS